MNRDRVYLFQDGNWCWTAMNILMLIMVGRSIKRLS